MLRLGKQRQSQTLASVIYRSRAVVGLSDTDLLALLASARATNVDVSVTGVLVYDRGRFFPWLEGPEASLTSVMQRIRSDLRHVEIAIQVHQEIPGRLFPQWAMNLVAREGESLPEIEGLVMAQPGTLDQLHLNDRRVPIVLASLSVAAWEAGKPAPGG